MTDRELELAMNNLNDLPGVTARAVLPSRQGRGNDVCRRGGRAAARVE